MSRDPANKKKIFGGPEGGRGGVGTVREEKRLQRKVQIDREGKPQKKPNKEKKTTKNLGLGRGENWGGN